MARKKEPSKAMSLRLDQEKMTELAAVAKVEGVTVSEVVREAVRKHIDTRSGDPEFQRRVRERMEESLKIMERLSRTELP